MEAVATVATLGGYAAVGSSAWVGAVSTVVGGLASIGSAVTSMTRGSGSKELKSPAAMSATIPKTTTDKAISAAAYAETEALRKRRGSASTIVTGPMGVLGTPTTLKTALGA